MFMEVLTGFGDPIRRRKSISRWDGRSVEPHDWCPGKQTERDDDIVSMLKTGCEKE
jgi:hypothetical protein